MLKKILSLRPITERKLGVPRPVHKFYNKDLFVVRSDKERPENTLCLNTGIMMTKPEIKQVLTKLYHLDIKKVNTWNKQGKIIRTSNKKFYRKKDIKRVIVELNTTVPVELQSIK